MKNILPEGIEDFHWQVVQLNSVEQKIVRVLIMNCIYINDSLQSRQRLCEAALRHRCALS